MSRRLRYPKRVGGGRDGQTNASLHFGRGRRLPLIRQSEAAECGLACLAMIAGYHGHHLELAELRQRFALSLQGITLAQLADIAESLGLAARALRLELDELAQLQLPCILHWELDHFVVLKSLQGNHALIHDPAVGARRVNHASLSQAFTGIALELNRSPRLERKPRPPPLSLRALAGSIEGLNKALLAVFTLALALELLSLLAPQYLQIVVDQVLADNDRDLLGFLCLSFFLLLLLQNAIGMLRSWTLIWLGSHFNLQWSGNVFQHLLRLPQSYFLNRHLGDIVSRFGAIASIQQSLTTQTVAAILDGLMAVLTLAMLGFYSLPLAGLVLAAILIYAGLRWLYYRIYREANLSQILVEAKRQSLFMESVRGVQTLRLYNQGGPQTSRYLNATADAVNTSITVQKLDLVFGSLHEFTAGAQRIGVIGLGAWLGLQGVFSAGMVMAFVAYADQFAGRATNLVDYLIRLRLLRLQGERLADIVHTASEPYADGRYAGSPPTPSIRFENVGFRYADGVPWVIKDGSFDIPAGTAVAIVGPSGCGKSTLIRLMLGLIDPQLGTIRIGGIDLKHLGKKRYRTMTAAVMQDDQLFAGSIADNISLFDEHATLAAIETAARAAQLHADILAMPMGYHSRVGDMGSALSGGQQQRLWLARALYRKPQVLILDEATSHLDLERERAIHEHLRSLAITWVFISHRPEPILQAQYVLHLRDKRISTQELRS